MYITNTIMKLINAITKGFGIPSQKAYIAKNTPRKNWLLSGLKTRGLAQFSMVLES